jgi:hypothetical protein
MAEKTDKRASTKLPENIEPLEAPDGEEVTEEQIEHAEKELFSAIASRIGQHQVIISKDHYALLKKMEDYAQDLAALVVRYFKEKDLEARKDLILKAVEVLKVNPPAGPGHSVNLHGPSLLNR